MNDLILNSALYYAKHGFPVFPCAQNGAPLTPHGFKDATDYAPQVTELFRGRDCFIGVPTGRIIGYTVIDVDKKNGGDKLFMDLCDWNEEFPATLQAETKSGGWHFYVKYTDQLHTVANIGGHKGIDIRNDGGYVIVPPSAGYSWLVEQGFGEITPCACPEWFIKLNTKKKDANPTFTNDKIDTSARNATLIRIAGTLRSANISFDNALVMLHKENKERCTPPLSDQELEGIVKSAFNYPTTPVIPGLDDDTPQTSTKKVDIKSGVQVEGNSKSRQPVDPATLKWDRVKVTKNHKGAVPLARTFNNILNIFRSDNNLFDVFIYNEFDKQIEIAHHANWMDVAALGDHIEDEVLVNIKKYLVTRYCLEYPIGIIDEAVTTIAMEKKHHPVKSYLESLTWDGIDRVNSWIVDYCGSKDTPYTREVGRIVLLAACRRIYYPGCKYDTMLILEGHQGIGKSRLVEALGGQWYGDVNIMARDKDTVAKMQGNWIIEVPEMVSFKKQDIESLKSFLSDSVDEVRPAYARKTKEFPRQSIFICTINPDQQGYLKDDTGNRRFLPVWLESIDLSAIQRDRDQLWAQAWALCKDRKQLTYINNKELLEEANQEQRTRETSDEMEDAVSKWLRFKTSERITGVEIWEGAFNKNKGDFGWHEQRRVGKIMRRIGWKKSTYKDSGCMVKGYVQPHDFKVDFVDENEKPF